MKCLGKCLVGLLLTASQSFGAAGTVGGGGGFSLATSLIEKTRDELATQLINVDDADVKKLVDLYIDRVQVDPNKYMDAKSVDKAYLYNLVKNIVHSKDKEAGDRVLSWNGNPQRGFQLEFLKPIYTQYGQLDFNQTSEAIKHELKRKLIHEASHTWGLGDLNPQDDLNSYKFSEDFLATVVNDILPTEAVIESEQVYSNNIVYSDVDICVQKKWPGKAVVFEDINCHGLSVVAQMGEEIQQRRQEEAGHARMDAVCKILGFDGGSLIRTKTLLSGHIPNPKPAYIPVNGRLITTTKHYYLYFEWWNIMPRRSGTQFFGEEAKSFECFRR